VELGEPVHPLERRARVQLSDHERAQRHHLPTAERSVPGVLEGAERRVGPLVGSHREAGVPGGGEAALERLVERPLEPVRRALGRPVRVYLHHGQPLLRLEIRDPKAGLGEALTVHVGLAGKGAVGEPAVALGAERVERREHLGKLVIAPQEHREVRAGIGPDLAIDETLYHGGHVRRPPRGSEAPTRRGFRAG
jgi:hypothetical protein